MKNPRKFITSDTRSPKSYTNVDAIFEAAFTADGTVRRDLLAYCRQDTWAVMMVHHGPLELCAKPEMQIGKDWI